MLKWDKQRSIEMKIYWKISKEDREIPEGKKEKGEIYSGEEDKDK